MQKELKRLFNRSNSVGDTSKGAVEGMGLGLGSSASQIRRAIKELNSKNLSILTTSELIKMVTSNYYVKHMTSGNYLSMPKVSK